MKIIHKTKYKNSILTFIFSMIIGFITLTIFKLIFKTDNFVSFTFGVIIFMIIFYWIGRKIIVRHIIKEDFNICIEFLLRPKYTIELTKKSVKNIEFKTLNIGRYGIYERGIIILKNNKNYHRDFITFNLNDETKWFWSDFNYPNRIKTAGNTS